MPADPRVGRASHGGFSPRMGKRDPRLRSNQLGGVTDDDLDKRTIARDGAGRQRLAAFDGIPPLAEGASLADVIRKVNQILQRGRGQ